MKRIAFGLITPDGFEPALKASTASSPWICAKASAIWLRLAFSTQTKRTRFFAVMESGPVRRQSAAGRLRRAARRALVDLRLHLAHVRRARGAVSGAGRIGGVVGRRVAMGVEGLPARALRVFGPQLVGVRVAAGRRVFGHHRGAGR